MLIDKVNKGMCSRFSGSMGVFGDCSLSSNVRLMVVSSV